MKALPLLALCAVVAPFAANAGSPADAAGPSITVHYAPNALVNPSEVEKLQAKIQAAAKRVCTENGTRGLDAARREDSCYARTVHAALKHVDDAHAYAVAAYAKPSAR